MPSFFYDFPGTGLVHTTFEHPEYQFWRPHWEMIRDSIIGEIEIKRRGERYLPKMENMEPAEYEAFLDRAVYFNMVQRTITGLMGSLFRRNAIIEHLPPGLDTANVSKQNQTLGQFIKEAAREIFATGRYGALVDMDEAGKRPPYLAGYLAENIVDWTIEEIEGRFLVTQIVLRELRLDRPLIEPGSTTPAGQKLPRTKAGQARIFSNQTTATRASRRWIASYRVLTLEPEDENDSESRRIYRQYYHTSATGDASPDGVPATKTTPQWRGQPFTFIPFVFMGPNDNTPDIDKSPLLDIVRMNHSHYKSYAQLEHGRYYTALPVYYTQVKTGLENAEYTVGPSVVWEVEEGCKPGIIEYNGSGLKYLESACNSKEDQIAALGGRLVGVERVSAGESNNQLKMKETNENALLLNVSNVLDTSFTALLRWWAYWQDVPQAAVDKINFETNKDFLMDKAGAREFRAIQMMFEAGVIPVEVLHDYLIRAEVVPDWMSVDQFVKLLSSPGSFPNQADVQARQRGAPSAAVEWEAEHVLVDPAVVAMRGYDSQAPAGQAPLPGQTAGGPVTAPQVMPQGKGAEPPPPVTPVPVAGPGKARTPAARPKPPKATNQGSGGTPIKDSGSGTPGEPLGGKHPHAQDTSAVVVGDPALTSTTTTV